MMIPFLPQQYSECNEMPPQSRCACGYTGNEIFVCPVCGALPEMIKGREIVVTSVEIEVAD